MRVQSITESWEATLLRANVYLVNYDMSKGHHAIKGGPNDKAAKMVDMFKAIGTIATIVNEAA